MFSNAFAVLDKAEDRDADGFQTVGDGRRKRNQLAKQDLIRANGPGAAAGGARNRNAGPNARHRAGRPRDNKAEQGSHYASESTRKDLAPVKVELCKQFEKGRCTRGAGCPFAHGPQELGTLNPRAAVQLTHWVDPAPALPGQHVRALAVSAEPTEDDCKRYKRRLCTFFEEGTCDQGVLCSFAHGEAELRRKGDPIPSIEYLRSLYTGAKIPDGEWFPAHQRFGENHGRLMHAFSADDDGAYPPLGGAGGGGGFHADAAPKPPVRGEVGASNGAPGRGPHVTPPSAGGRHLEAGHGAAHVPGPAETRLDYGHQAADERAQLAAALAASRIEDGPRQGSVASTPAPPLPVPQGFDNPPAAVVARPAARPRMPYNPLIAAKRRPAMPPPQPPLQDAPSAMPPSQQPHQSQHQHRQPSLQTQAPAQYQPGRPPIQQQQQPPQAPQPPLVFGKFDDAMSDDDKNDDKNTGDRNDGFDDEEEDYPHAFLCPIAHDLMDDPVVAADGVTYERSFIEDWFSRSSDSPLMGMRLEHKHLIPNVALRAAIRRQYPNRFPASPL